MGSSSPAPTPFQPPNQAGAASAFQSGAGALAQGGQQVQGQAIPGYQAIYDAVRGNPYYAGAQQSANQVGAAGQAFGQSEVGAAQGLQGIAQNLGQYAPAIAQSGFDQNGALYNRTQQQVAEQANSQAAQSGVAGSPFGAGLANDANRNFNIDWQAGQQQRQLAAMQGLQGLAQTQSGIQGEAGALGTAGLNAEAAGGQMGSQAYLAHQTDISRALDQLVQGDNQAYGLTQQSVQDQGQYLGIGQQASAGALNSWEAQQKADQAFWGGIGSLLGQGAMMAFGI